jgi:hypothetical protein
MRIIGGRGVRGVKCVQVCQQGQIPTSILPPLAKTIVQNPFIKTMQPHQPPALPALTPAFIS